MLEGRVAVTTDEGWRHSWTASARRLHAGRVLLVVDQLEEIFTQAPPNARWFLVGGQAARAARVLCARADHASRLPLTS